MDTYQIESFAVMAYEASLLSIHGKESMLIKV